MFDIEKRLVALLAVALLVGVGIGGTAARTILFPRGSIAMFQGNGWSCVNRGTPVTCQTGDAHPYVTVGVDRRVVALRVNSLRKPCVRRVLRPSPDPTDPLMRPYTEYLYTFRAFGCP
jgi:hypothetical protein